MPHPPQIPLTPQTNEANFPRWEGEKAAPGRSGARYPKMLTQIVTRQFRDEWVQSHRRVDQNTRQEYWEEAPPRVGAQTPLLTTQDMVAEGLASFPNEPIIVNDKEEEQRVLEYLGLLEPAPKPQSVAIPIRPAVQASTPVTSDEWVDPLPPKKKRGRPPKVRLNDGN